LQTSGSFIALNSYENRVYQIGLVSEKPIIAKFYRPERWTDAAILEEHAFALDLQQQEIPIVAPLIVNDQTLHVFKEFRFAIFPSMGGRTFEYGNLEHLAWMGRFIGRIHSMGAVKPFAHRIKLDTVTYGSTALANIKAGNFVPSHLAEKFYTLVESCLHMIDQLILLIDPQYIRLHGDFHAGNILWRDEGPHIVDLDDCLMAPQMQDIWMLLSGEDEKENQLQLNTILQGYEDFYEFDDRQLRLIEPLRTLRMIHYSGWLAKRWHDPAFPLSFSWFDTPQYWASQYHQLMDQAHMLTNLLNVIAR